MNGRPVCGVVNETSTWERRVAVVPDAVDRLRNAGLDVLVETGAGEGGWFTDDAYADAGAKVVSRRELLEHGDILLTVAKPDDDVVAHLRPGHTVIGMLEPLADPHLAHRLAGQGVTAISLDCLPRTLSRAQPMDALTSQASIAGYKAALVAATAYGGFFPLLISAAGTARPAEVLVLGAGVAGLQAIGTARRLGAVVRGYDVRPETRAEVESLGASFLTLDTVVDAAGAGGYARALIPAERLAQQEELTEHITRQNVVITTARVPGRRPPLLVTARAVATMTPRSVIVDLAASPFGGNVELSRPSETIITDNGVTVIGAENLPATMPEAASTAYARNISALLLHLVRDGELIIDLDDEIQAGVVITHAGTVVHPATARLLQPTTSGGTP